MARPFIRLQGAGPEFEGTIWESDRLLRVGRTANLEVKLTDSSLSRRHAEVLFTPQQGWVVRDLGSKNGTFLNGIRVGQAERKLEERDVLQFGNIVLMVASLAEGPQASGAPPLSGNWQVQATAQHSWEEALEMLAMDVTRRTRPGEQLLTLLRAGQHLYQVGSLDDLLRMNLQDAVTALKAQRGAILLADAATGNLAVHAVSSERKDLGDSGIFSRTLVERCFRRGESLLCNDVCTDPELLRAQSISKGSMTSIICALLRTPRTSLGVLHLDRGPAQEPFSMEDLHLADGLAAGISGSVAGARMIQDKQRNVFIQTVLALAQTLELRDPYTSGHAQRVTDYALLLAEELNLSAADRQTLQVAAPLHDIGKIGVSDTVLQKRGILTADEFDQMKAHPLKGAALLQAIPDLAPIVPIVRGHHERWDGLGYPDGLAGEQIPQLARVIAVADTFDAISFDSPYREAMTLDDAFEQIQQGSGSQFEPACVEAFLQLRSRLEQQFQQRTRLHRTAREVCVPCLN